MLGQMLQQGCGVAFARAISHSCEAGCAHGAPLEPIILLEDHRIVVRYRHACKRAPVLKAQRTSAKGRVQKIGWARV
eukprot:11218417-Lingulodinium_polyedra.AAC.1